MLEQCCKHSEQCCDAGVELKIVVANRHLSIGKTTTLHVHHAFLCISLPSLHDYDLKLPNFTFFWRT